MFHIIYSIFFYTGSWTLTYKLIQNPQHEQDNPSHKNNQTNKKSHAKSIFLNFFSVVGIKKKKNYFTVSHENKIFPSTLCVWLGCQHPRNAKTFVPLQPVNIPLWAFFTEQSCWITGLFDGLAPGHTPQVRLPPSSPHFYPNLLPTASNCQHPWRPHSNRLQNHTLC